jgi:hypothetical protein
MAANVDAWPVMEKQALYNRGVGDRVACVIVGCFFNPSYSVPQFIAVLDSGYVVSDHVGRFQITTPIQARS